MLLFTDVAWKKQRFTTYTNFIAELRHPCQHVRSILLASTLLDIFANIRCSGGAASSAGLANEPEWEHRQDLQ